MAAMFLFCILHIFKKLHVFWNIYSAFTEKIERKCRFPAPGWNCMTHREALQGFPDTIQISLHLNNKINLPTL
jgi:hypothetical protein